MCQLDFTWQMPYGTPIWNPYVHSIWNVHIDSICNAHVDSIWNPYGSPICMISIWVPYGFAIGVPPSSAETGSGERRWAPQWGPERSPGEKRIWCILSVTEHFCLQDIMMYQKCRIIIIFNSFLQFLKQPSLCFFSWSICFKVCSLWHRRPWRYLLFILTHFYLDVARNSSQKRRIGPQEPKIETESWVEVDFLRSSRSPEHSPGSKLFWHENQLKCIYWVHSSRKSFFLFFWKFKKRDFLRFLKMTCQKKQKKRNYINTAWSYLNVQNFPYTVHVRFNTSGLTITDCLSA